MYRENMNTATATNDGGWKTMGGHTWLVERGCTPPRSFGRSDKIFSRLRRSIHILLAIYI